MPRGPRLDAPPQNRRTSPGVLPARRASPPEADKHRVMARGLERRAIFRDARDRADFVQRLAALAAARAWTVYVTATRDGEVVD